MREVWTETIFSKKGGSILASLKKIFCVRKNKKEVSDRPADGN